MCFLLYTCFRTGDKAKEKHDAEREPSSTVDGSHPQEVNMAPTTQTLPIYEPQQGETQTVGTDAEGA
jgi:hypothetical protein